MDEQIRKQKRKLSNRESAKRSRMKKQRHLEELVTAAAQLKRENGRILERVESLSRHHQRLESENDAIRAKKMELAETLRSLNSVLRFVEEVTVDVNENPDLLRSPWRPPVMASGDMLHC